MAVHAAKNSSNCRWNSQKLQISNLSLRPSFHYIRRKSLRQLFDIFYIPKIQTIIVSAQTIRGNTVAKSWAICQNWCFGQFFRSLIKVLKIAQLFSKADILVIFVSVSFVSQIWEAKKKIYLSRMLFLVLRKGSSI